MKLVHPTLSTPIEFHEGRIPVLVIENKRLYVNLVQEILTQCEGEEGRFVLSDKDKQIDFKKYVQFLLTPFQIDLNSKKIISGILGQIEEHSRSEEMYFDTQETMSALNGYMQRLIEQSDYPLVYTECDVSTVLKSAEIKTNYEATSLLEQVVDYMGIAEGVLKAKCFIFLNLLSYFQEEEIRMLYQSIHYRKFNVLFVEQMVPDAKTEDVQMIILDNDLCEIIY